MVQTSSPRHRAEDGAEPLSRRNSSRNGPGPSRRRACVIADAPGLAAGSPSSPDTSRSQTSW